MRTELRAVIASSLGVCLGLGTMAEARAGIDPPPQPQAGYGSTESYISDRHRERFVGNPLVPWAGDWCWYFEPRELAYGDRAPVVIFLHGFALLAPDIYDRHIEHLTRQGVIVVFPQINKGGLLGLLTDFDQYQMLDRAIEATNRCLRRIGDDAAPGETYLYGHSLGALLGAVWQSHPAAAPIDGLVLANPSMSGLGAIPPFVRDLIGDAFVEIDWQPLVAETTVPTVILAGDADTLAPPDQALDLQAAMINAPSAPVYMAMTDRYAGEGLVADHMAPINNDGILPDFVMELLGGRARTHAIDHRFYWATLDAVMDGVAAVDHDMGQWSDGTPVLDVVTLSP